MLPARDAGPFIPHPRENLNLACSTICNLRCRFCPYRQNTLKREIIEQDLFCDAVEQACDLGFDAFGLTPVIGEAFVDPAFGRKVSFLEEHGSVKRYWLTSNFTVACSDFIDSLPGLQKLSYLSISVYGHDEESFSQIAGAGPEVWQGLLRNLRRLADVLPPTPARTRLRVRSKAGITREAFCFELRDVIDRLVAKNVVIEMPTHYYNWGGLIQDEDLKVLETPMTSLATERRGPCSMLLFNNVVLPDGRISACACRDSQGLLIIGDLKRQSLRTIYSTGNSAYMRLIGSQEQGEYGDLCGKCNMFRSTHKLYSAYQYHKKPRVTLEQFFEVLEHSGDRLRNSRNPNRAVANKQRRNSGVA
jgi:hypothetical protein